jgi:hypothetical protein
LQNARRRLKGVIRRSRGGSRSGSPTSRPNLGWEVAPMREILLVVVLTALFIVGGAKKQA